MKRRLTLAIDSSQLEELLTLNFLLYSSRAILAHLKRTFKVHHVLLHFINSAFVQTRLLHHLWRSINNSFSLLFLHKNDYHNFVLVSNTVMDFAADQNRFFSYVNSRLLSPSFLNVRSRFKFIYV